MQFLMRVICWKIWVLNGKWFFFFQLENKYVKFSYQQLMRIGARRRLLLTGTPLQNNLLGTFNHQWYFQLFVFKNWDFGQNSEYSPIKINSELISLLKFIMPDLLQKSSATLNKIFKLRNSESDFAKQRVKEAKTILQVLLLFSKIIFLITFVAVRFTKSKIRCFTRSSA